MSTKNLSRTVIEGGRTGYSRFARRRSHGVARTHTHVLERQLGTRLDPENAVFPARESVWKDFDDKLGPARRWLRSQAGRPWDKVRSALFTRFDIRTTAGRHIVFDHLLEEVRTEPFNPYHWREFWISEHGILRYQQRDRKRYSAAWRLRQLPEPEAVLLAWLGARRVIQHGARLYWLVATPQGAFRQQHELAQADARRFRALPDWFRERFEGPSPIAGGA